MTPRVLPSRAAVSMLCEPARRRCARAQAESTARPEKAARKGPDMPNQPNVLFIVSDQHNAKVLAHKGHPDVQTPNLDRLAAEGVRFDNAITQNPICTPSRVSFLSGQYCHNHGYYGLLGPRPAGLPTILGHFRRHGYNTGAIGKIHCPEYWVEDDSDYFREVGNCSIGGNAEYQAYLRGKGVWEALKNSGGRRGPYGQCMDGFPSEQTYRDSPEGWCVTEAVGFMQGTHEAGAPFFLHVSLPKPHEVYCPAPEFWEMYDPQRLHLPPNADYDLAEAQKAPNLRRTLEGWRRGDWTAFEPRTYEAGRLRKYRGYLGCVSHVDHAVGELLAFLDASGLAADTVVLYTSDHGDYACEHGIIEKAPGICADAITRVPMLWRWPAHLKAGHVAEELVELVDVPVTLCALAALAPMPTADGKDISHMLAGERRAVRDIAVTEFAWSRSVRKGRYRLVYYPPEQFAEQYPEGFGELYDLENDPWEMRNLYFFPEYADVVAQMERDLLDWLVTTTRPTTVLPDHKTIGRDWTTRYSNSVLADGKINPDEVRERAVRLGNYV